MKSRKMNLCGPKIKAKRVENGLKIEEVEARLENYGVALSRWAIGRIENGKRSISDIELFAYSELFKIDDFRELFPSRVID